MEKKVNAFCGVPFKQDAHGLLPIWRRWLIPTNPDTEELPEDYWEFQGYYQLVEVTVAGLDLLDSLGNPIFASFGDRQRDIILQANLEEIPSLLRQFSKH